VTSINLADELVILLIFVNNEHLLTQSQWERFVCRQNANADAAWAGIRSNLSKAIICVYKNNLMMDTLNT